MRRRLTLAALVALVSLSGIATPADARRPPLFRIFEAEGPGGEPVGFQVRPDKEYTALGETATWRNRGELPHSLVDRSGLFAWGPIEPGEELSFRPWAAGRYRFTDAAAPDGHAAGTWETGMLSVSPLLRWVRATRNPTFQVRWASRPAPQGLVYDVQVPRVSLRFRSVAVVAPWRRRARRSLHVPLVLRLLRVPRPAAGSRAPSAPPRLELWGARVSHFLMANGRRRSGRR